MPKEKTAEPQIDRLPPQDLQAERAVLGAMLQEATAVSKAFELLQDICFYDGNHRLIFQALQTLFEKNSPCDVLTTAAQLRQMKKLDAIGGNYYLTELIASVPSAANVDYHAKIVLEKHMLRSIISTGHEICSAAFDNSLPAAEIIDAAEQRIFAISARGLRQGFTYLNPILHKTFQQIETYHQHGGGITGLPTGFTQIDTMTCGLQASDLIIVAGRPSMGKTAFCLNIARNVAVDSKIAVGIFSLEMANHQLAMRLLCSESQVDSHLVRSGKLPREQFSRLVRGVGRLAEAQIYIDDTGALSITEIRAKARRLYAEKQVGLIIVDYLQLVHSPKSENRVIEISIISQALKALAKELKIPVIALSQLSRALETRVGDKRPQLSDLRDSGAIEQDADVVMFIYRPEVYARELNDNLAEVIIAKQRNGPIGTANLVFLKEYITFVNAEMHQTEASVSGLPF